MDSKKGPLEALGEGCAYAGCLSIVVILALLLVLAIKWLAKLVMA